MRVLSIILTTLLFIGCASTQSKIQYTEKVKKSQVSIKWDTTYTYPTTEEGVLIIKNPKTGKEFSMTYADFFILKQSYKNWRAVESSDPVITDVTQDDDEIIVSFNYFDENSKSVLAGQFIVDMGYVVENANNKKIKIMEGALYGTGAYSLVITIAFLIVCL